MTFLYHKLSKKFLRTFSGKVLLFFRKFPEKHLQEISQSQLTTLLAGSSTLRQNFKYLNTWRGQDGFFWYCIPCFTNSDRETVPS